MRGSPALRRLLLARFAEDGVEASPDQLLLTASGTQAIDLVCRFLLRPGDTVQIKTMGVKAQVLSVSKDGTVSLKAGIMTVSAKEDELLLLEEAQPSKQENAHIQGGGARLMHVPTEIDLRGMESIEAVLAAERYLDSAAMAHLKTVTIIHGKGTGVLRDAVRKMLKTNKLVKSWRQGLYGEGEVGVTVVELK